MDLKMASFHHQISGVTKEMDPQQQQQFATDESQHQIEILKRNLQLHSVKLAEMCAKFTVDSQQAETAESQELKITEQLQKQTRELEEKLEQISLKIAAVKSNCQPLQAKVKSTVQFGKALSEHHPQMIKSVEELKMARDLEQAAVDDLEKDVSVLLADYKALHLRFVEDLSQLRDEVRKERETRVASITQHNQKIAEIQNQIKETQFLSAKEESITANLKVAIENEQKQKSVLDQRFRSNETEFNAEHALVKANLDEIQSSIPKHRESIDRSIAMKSEYQKLIPLMNELEIDQKETDEFLISIGLEKTKIVENLELSTNIKMSAEQEISKTLADIDKSTAIEQAMRNDRASLIEKLQLVEKKLSEKNIEVSGLEVYLESLNETKMNIDLSKEELMSKYNLVQSSIEKVNLDIQVNGEELVKFQQQLTYLEETVSVVLGEISLVETDCETVAAERTEIERALTETRSQIEQMIAAKAELVEQVQAIDIKLDTINSEKIDLMKSIDEAELGLQSLLNKNSEMEEKIKATMSSSENLKGQILEISSYIETLEATVNSTEKEINITVDKTNNAKADLETLTNDFKQNAQVLESALLAKEKAINENCVVKTELKIAYEMKEQKDTEIQIVKGELAINKAMEKAIKEQADILHLQNEELVQEEEESLVIFANIKKIIDEQTLVTEESVKKLAVLQEKKIEDSKAIAITKSDFNKNVAAELEIVHKIKELEASNAAAQLQHEENLRAIAEEDRKTAEEEPSMEELQAHLKSVSEEHLEEKAKLEALDLKVKELKATLEDQKLKENDDLELVKENEQLKQERDKLEKQLQANLQSKAERRAGVRAVSRQWFADMAALKKELAEEQMKIQELTSVLALPVLPDTKSQPSKTTPTAKSPSVGEASSSGSKSSTKRTVYAAKTAKERSPRTPTLKVKSPVLARLCGKSPVITGSHANPPSSCLGKENLSPDEVENSPPILTSSMRKKMKTSQ